MFRFRPNAGERKPLVTRRRSFVLRALGDSPELFSGTETMVRDSEQGILSVTEQTVYQAGCKHLVGFMSPAELAGECECCGKSLCYRCQIRCYRCHALLCPTCAKSTDEGAPFYCQRCKVIVLAKRYTVGLLKGLHGVCSKEF